MNELRIRPAEAKDLPDLDRLLYQVHKVHSDARPDLFKPGAKKYTGEELKKSLPTRTRRSSSPSWTDRSRDTPSAFTSSFRRKAA